MQDNQHKAGDDTVVDADTTELTPRPDSEQTQIVKPDWVPQKFWNADKQEVRIQDLAHSYILLEKKLSATIAQQKASPPTQESQATSEAELTNTDTDADASETADVLPAALAQWAEELSQQYQTSLSQEILSHHFGGEEQWQKIQTRLNDWGKRNLPQEAYQSLASSVDGIKALHRLMRTSEGEPELVDGGSIPVAIDEPRLHQMMRDPRYWRERDPSFVNRVLAGFKQLYDN